MDSVRDKNILNKKPKIRVVTENIVKIATALNNDLITSPQIFIIYCIVKIVKTCIIIKCLRIYFKFL